jgi:hypothetical protein
MNTAMVTRCDREFSFEGVVFKVRAVARRWPQFRSKSQDGDVDISHVESFLKLIPYCPDTTHLSFRTMVQYNLTSFLSEIWIWSSSYALQIPFYEFAGQCTLHIQAAMISC